MDVDVELPCECSTDSYFVRRDPQAARRELGPAYEDYESGAVKLTRRWEGTRSLIGDWIDPCCTELHDWKFAEGWVDHTVMLAVFLFLAILVAVAFTVMRDRQPFKFRDLKAIVLHLFVISLVMVAGVLTGNMGGTAPILPAILASFCAGPVLFYYYIVKNLQLLFVYKWNQAKLDKKLYEQLQTFQKYRFVLDFRFYLAGFALVLFLSASPVIYAMNERNAFQEAVKTNTFETIRCEWWKIPEEYTVPTSTSTLCSCIALQAPIPGGDTTACVGAVYDLCINMEPGVPEDEGFCDICFAGYASGQITSECEAWFENFYLSGYCGFPSRVPHQSTCKGSVFADPTMGYWAGSINYLMIVLNFAVLGLLWGKQDDFGIKQDNMFNSTLASITVFFQFVKIYPNDGGMLEWYYDGLGFEYDPMFVFIWLVSWGLLVSTFCIPFSIFVYREHMIQGKPKKTRTESLRSVPSTAVETPVSEPYQSIAMNDADTVDECIQDPALRQIYGKYTVEAFHAENVRFLTDCSAFVQAARGQLDGAMILTLAADARTLVNQYIQRDAPLGVNIHSRQRSAIQKHLEQYEKTIAELGDVVNTAESNQEGKARRSFTLPLATIVQLTPTLEALTNAFSDAYFEIRRLLAQDSWPRFKLSRHYKQYEALIQEARRMTYAVEERVTPRGSNRPKSTTGLPAHPSLAASTTVTTSEATSSEQDQTRADRRLDRASGRPSTEVKHSVSDFLSNDDNML